MKTVFFFFFFFSPISPGNHNSPTSDHPDHNCSNDRILLYFCGPLKLFLCELCIQGAYGFLYHTYSSVNYVLVVERVGLERLKASYLILLASR